MRVGDDRGGTFDWSEKLIMGNDDTNLSSATDESSRSAQEEGFRGKKNRYRCEACHKSIITIDRDEGVTPFMLPCMVTAGCVGPMTSRFYVVEDVWPEPSYEWRKPTKKEYKRSSPAMKQHFDQGGLDIHAIHNSPARETGTRTIR